MNLEYWRERGRLDGESDRYPLYWVLAAVGLVNEAIAYEVARAGAIPYWAKGVFDGPRD